MKKEGEQKKFLFAIAGSRTCHSSNDLAPQTWPS